MILHPLNSLGGSIGKILTPDLNLTRLFSYTVFLRNNNTNDYNLRDYGRYRPLNSKTQEGISQNKY